MMQNQIARASIAIPTIATPIPTPTAAPVESAGFELLKEAGMEVGFCQIVTITFPLGYLPPLLTYTAYDYYMSHSFLLTNTV
jgi:hypothetical protein